MISNKLEAGTDYETVGSVESVMTSITKNSSCYGDNSGRGGKEPKKKLKKLSSIKLSRFPSLRSSKRLMKSRNDRLLIALSANPSGSGQTTPSKLSDVSPSYMKATSSSDARKGSFQASNLLNPVLVTTIIQE